MNRKGLAGKVVVITGAAGGIGSAAAGLFARCGARVVLTDIRRPGLDALRDRLAAGGGEVRVFPHDVSDLDSWRTLVREVQDAYGRFDVLVNNAGIVQPGALEALSPEKIRQQVVVNLLGTIYGCRTALEVMKAQGHGKIVNVASLGGVVPMPGEAVYSATKAAIRALTFSLAAELRNSPLSVTAVSPDSVATAQLEYELRHDEAVMSFVGKPLRPEAVARAILRAARSRRPEIMVPGATGILARFVMAFPRLFFRVGPLLEKAGRRNILKRRAALRISPREVEP
jgi:3-oxoacyl-[acyl-carrier protein] reductase